MVERNLQRTKQLLRIISRRKFCAQPTSHMSHSNGIKLIGIHAFPYLWLGLVNFFVF